VTDDVDLLLAAPRGRGLCAAMDGDVFEALSLCVVNAAYWQEPLDGPQISRPDAADFYRPTAEAVLRSAETSWWRSPAPLDDQWYVDLLHEDASPARGLPGGAVAGLAGWRANELRPRPSTPGVDPWEISGRWWSAPIADGVVRTSRLRPDLGPIGLWLVEDEMGWERARCTPVAPSRPPRVYEIHRPADWLELARRYPLDVTDSRAPDWRRATGRAGRWVIPDWTSVAKDHDAVHVSVWGYLLTAGRPIPVDSDRATLLAGWSPDETYWLADCLRESGPGVDYLRSSDGWEPVRD
jgi:hypothetical protein